MENDIPIKWGPWGRRRAYSVNWDDGVHQKIKKILVSYSELHGITFQAVYNDSDNIQMGPQPGSNEATSFTTIHITKAITQIDATYQYVGRGRITSLEFSSGASSYGSIGRKSDHSFTFKSDLGFSGFHGSVYGKSLTSLGVYINTPTQQYLRRHALAPTNIFSLSFFSQ